ncbi:MAG: SDR family NAD(P)-dependent oxidoreductase [Gammaproteobacteria bacterium]
MSGVNGKVVLVTGAASNPGLGRSIALLLGARGAHVVATDLDGVGAESCAAAIRADGGSAIGLRHDVVSEEDWTSVMDATLRAFGRLDVLVNNAGIAILKRTGELSLADWNRQIATNLTSVFIGSKLAMEHMKASGGGSIINMSSVAGLVGMKRCVAYGASKGGVRAMSKSIAIDGAEHNIRCNSVHPGVIWTNMQSAAAGSRSIVDARAAPERVPLGRAGQPEDVAHCVLYLASEEASYVTGAEFIIDAGMTAQ